MTETIAFIGAGNMARAIIGGLCRAGQPASALRVTDIQTDVADRLAADFGVTTCPSGEDAARGAAVVVLAVKPQQLREVALALRPVLAGSHTLVLSIAAGITTAALARWLGDGTAIVRSMPNTPALIGRGTAALYANDRTTAAQREQATRILAAVGAVHWLTDETQMDAVTALSGSGPAYVFRLLETLSRAGELLGLPAELAAGLARETVAGAALLAEASPLPAATLRAQVTSRGGTTERALETLDSGGLDALFERALRAARDRSETLSAEFGGA